MMKPQCHINPYAAELFAGNFLFLNLGQGARILGVHENRGFLPGQGEDIFSEPGL